MSVSNSTDCAFPTFAPAAEAPAPAATFAALGLPPALLAAVRAMGFESPTPIQQRAIPLLLAGRDLMASAATGSGKTAAFLLPILHRLAGRPRGGTRALVLAPTRELAAQILDHFRQLSAGTGLRAAAIYGGVAMQPQVQAFRAGTDVLIATPGRLLDHFQYPYAKLDQLECLVLDEADRMLDLGFLPDIRRVLHHIPRKRQTLLFSATLPEPILELARTMLHEPATLHIERRQAPARGITHRAFGVAAELKSRLLVEILRRENPGRVLAFTRTRHRANRLADFLVKEGVRCDRIHGSRSQAQRTEALARFKQGRCQVLVATDIAARGIDVTALDLVVNFDVPGAAEDYIHRSGRTARAEATGCAYTLVAPDEESGWRAIEHGIGRRVPREALPDFDYRQKVEGKLEIPLAERIAAIRTRKAEERARAKAKLERKAQAAAQGRGDGGTGRRGERKPAPPRPADAQPEFPPEMARFQGRGPVADLTLGGRIDPKPIRRTDTPVIPDWRGSQPMARGNGSVSKKSAGRRHSHGRNSGPGRRDR